MFFFEKKNQKTFATWPTRPSSDWVASGKAQKFFASFFQKRRPFLLFRPVAVRDCRRGTSRSRSPDKARNTAVSVACRGRGRAKPLRIAAPASVPIVVT
jgi:hypothetical protein